MVGNAIAVPHALLCLVNTIGQPQHTPWMSTPVDIIDRALDHSLSASRQEVLLWTDKGKVHIGRFAVSPTLQWSCETPQFALWKVPCGPNFQTLFVQPGLRTAQVIRSVFPQATGVSLGWRPAKFPDIQMPLTVSDRSGFDTMTFDGLFGHFSIHESDFVRYNRPFVLIFTPDHIFVLHKLSTTKVQEVHNQLFNYLSMDDTTCDIWGFPIEPNSNCPDAVCFMSPIRDTPPSDFLQSLIWHREESCRYVEAEYSVLFAYIRFAQDVGLASMIECLGWSMSLAPAIGARRPIPRLMWQPRPDVPAVHADVFDTSFTTKLAQALFPPDIPSWDAVHIRIKFWSLWQPAKTLDKSTRVEDILKPWRIASRHVGKPSHLRAVFRGQQLMNEHTLSSYLPSVDSRDVMKVHLVLELQGGGNKREAHQKLRQSIVECLLQSGADPASVNVFTKDLYEKAGFARLQHTMQFRDPEERLSQLMRLAKSMHIRPITIESLDSERQKKLKTWRPRVMPSFATVHAADFRIHPEAFVKADNQPAPILANPEAPKDGVILLDADCAPEFAKSLKPQPENLAIAVVGRECTLGPEGCQTINLPVLDRHGAQVILKACLHQCGKSRITLKTREVDDIPIEESKLVAVTAWRMNSPVMLGLPLCIAQQNFVRLSYPSHRRRAFRDEGAVCEPESASSFQYHVHIKASCLDAILKRSGFDGIYVTPKSETLNRADEVYAVVWQPHTLQQVSDFAKGLDCQLGIAGSNTGTVHHGVRIHSDRFAETFSKAFPDKKVPPVLVTHFLAKVSPTPIGASMDNVRAWLQSQGIQGKPVKALGSSAWMISTVDRPKRGFLTWGSNSILISPITPWGEKAKPTVVAGQARVQHFLQVPDDSFEDPLQSADPWAVWTPSSSASSSSAVTRDSSSSGLSGPIQSQMPQQTEISMLKDRLTTLESQGEQRYKTDQAWKANMTRDMKAVKSEIRQDLQTFQTSYESSLTKALQQTESKLGKSMNDAIAQLQQFMVQHTRSTSKRPGPPSPVKEDEDADMGAGEKR